jgi:(p)ppGpp synthase/HD superfamily hydrolase
MKLISPLMNLKEESNHKTLKLTLLSSEAYEFAEFHHRVQKRSSGEPYIIHPINVAATLIKLKWIWTVLFRTPS